MSTTYARRDRGVEAPRLVVVGDRVRQRRPRELEAAHRDDHARRELHGDGEQAGRGRRSARSRYARSTTLSAKTAASAAPIGTPKRSSGLEGSGVPHAEPARLVARDAEQRTTGAGDVVAEHVAVRAPSRTTTSVTVSPTVSSTFAIRREDERPAALLDAQQRVGHLEVRERPQPEHAEAASARRGGRTAASAQRPGEGQRRSRDEGRDDGSTVPRAVRAEPRRASASSSVNQSRTNASPRPRAARSTRG